MDGVTDPQETIESDAIREDAIENGEDLLTERLDRFADALGQEETFEILVRWRCERAGHEFEVVIEGNQPTTIRCARAECHETWRVEGK